MEHTYLGTFVKPLRFRYKRLDMKQKVLFFSGDSNRDQTEKRVYASSSRGEQISSKGCVVVHILEYQERKTHGKYNR